MLKFKYLILSLALLYPMVNFANDFQITRFQLKLDDRGRSNKLSAMISLKWKNSWNNAKNHDAIWVFLKLGFGDRLNGHARINPENYRVLRSNVKLKIDIPKDKRGFFVYLAQKYRGDVECTVLVSIEKGKGPQRRIGALRGKAYGIEMVYVPKGGFTLGDPDPAAAQYYQAFYRAGTDGKPGGLFKITSEGQTIDVGPEKGKLYYQSRNKYHGDQKGSIPTTFPKGVRAFYVMKYEITQGQYAAFLNNIRSGQTQYRVAIGVKGYYKYRGTIKIKKDRYVAEKPNRPCNYISWDDGCAFADWAALRPWTELEFTKACRGPQKPMAHEFPWNTNSRDKLQRVVNQNNDLVMLNGMDESKLTDQNRDQFGASYYWVMDLAGSVWERVVTIGDPVGRAFKGTHGDGRLSNYGFATNQDWPKGNLETGGYGYRGGGFYEYIIQMSDYNPYSPIAYRPYGSWSGGDRSKAYSNRYARTADAEK